MNTKYIVKAVGLCKSKVVSGGILMLFREVKIKLSRKYWLYGMPGDNRYLQFDPVEFENKFEIMELKRI
jgi:hypothetical protein